MTLVAWNDSLCIGVKEIDEQHQRLFQLANEVAATLERGFDKEAVAKDLRALCDYAVDHFAAEEALMDLDVDGYPEYDQHVSEHMQCTTKALDFLGAFAEDKAVDMNEFLQFVTLWIRDHIQSMDQTLATFLRGRIPTA